MKFFSSYVKAYLALFQTPAMEIFWENSEGLLAVNCFCKKSFIIDAWQFPKDVSDMKVKK